MSFHRNESVFECQQVEPTFYQSEKPYNIPDVLSELYYVGGLFLLLLIVCTFLSADPTYAFGDRYLLCILVHHSILMCVIVPSLLHTLPLLSIECFVFFYCNFV